MHTNDKGEPWLPHSASSKPRACSPTSSNVPIRLVIVLSIPDVEAERENGKQLADKWHEVISSGTSGQAAIIDVHSWVCKTTLDACVGESRTMFFILTDSKPVSEMGRLDMTSALWKAPTTDSRSHTQTWCTVPLLFNHRSCCDDGIS